MVEIRILNKYLLAGKGRIYMKFIISGKHIEVTDALREKVESKLGRLEKFLNKGTEVHVTMSVQKNRHILEVTIPFHHIVLRAEETHEDMYENIDRVVDVIERQIRKNKTRLSRKLHAGPVRFDKLDQGNDVLEEHEFKIVRSKKFAFKPMDVEEAILQMNLLGHEFFMFSNSDTNKSNVVYKRKDGNYGLIEPDF